MLKKRNQKGFTLIEIIAVLVILGILAAVAIPRYLDLQEESRNKAALGAVSEAKARLSSAYAKALMVLNGTNPTTAQIKGNGNFATGSWGDYVVVVGDEDDNVTITVSQVQNTNLTTNVTGTWTRPTP